MASADMAEDEERQRARDFETPAALLQAGKWAELDQLAHDMRALKYASGRSRLHQFYLGLRKAAQPAQVEAWLDARDESIPARLLAVQNDPEKAREWLKRLKECKDPYVWVFALEFEQKRDELQATLQKALALDRAYFEAYQAAALRVPKKELAEFADWCTGRNYKLSDGTYAIVYSAFVNDFGKDPFRQQEAGFMHDRIVAGYRQLLGEHVSHPHWLSLFTKATACWDDVALAAELGRRLGPWRDPDVWTQRQWDGFQKWLQTQ